jgi:hypothetical protein
VPEANRASRTIGNSEKGWNSPQDREKLPVTTGTSNQTRAEVSWIPTPIAIELKVIATI